MRCHVVVETESPVCVARRHSIPGLPVETLPYIPGSALRGAVAEAWLKADGPGAARAGVEEDFQSVFTNADVRWGNLYPSSDMRVSYPIPLTALTCKWIGGFLTDDSETQVGHGVWDTLAWQSGRERTGVGGCRECGAPLEGLDGFYHQGRYGPACVRPKTRLLTRTALMEKTRTAKAGMLFTLEVIEELQQFAGFLQIPEDAPGIGCLRQILAPGSTFRLGTAKTRGLGAIKVLSADSCQGGRLGLAPLSDRLAGLQQAVRDVVGSADRFWFALTLYSDAIVTDVWGSFRSVIDAASLQLETRFWGGAPAFPASLCHCSSSAATHCVSGWSTADGWQLPKYDVVAIRKGSSFLFSVDPRDGPAATECLAELEARGVGDRRQEGFGEVIVSSPFHADPEGGARIEP